MKLQIPGTSRIHREIRRERKAAILDAEWIGAFGFDRGGW
jgi:hypothetical protein